MDKAQRVLLRRGASFAVGHVCISGRCCSFPGAAYGGPDSPCRAAASAVYARIRRVNVREALRLRGGVYRAGGVHGGDGLCHVGARSAWGR